jgi:hypothetical protein
MAILSKALLFLFFSTGLHAQPVIQWSQPFDAKKQPEWLGYQQGRYYFTQLSKDSGLQLWVYGKDGKQLCRSALDPKAFGKSFDYKWTFLNSNGPYHHFLEDIKKEGLRLAGLGSQNHCSPLAETEPLSKPGEVDFYSPYRTAISPNGDFKMKYRDIISTKGGILHYLILDKNGKIATYDSYNFGSLKGVLTEAYVDNAGRPYLLLRNYRTKKEREPGQADQFSVWVKLEKGKEPNVFPLDYPNLQLAGVDVLAAPDNGFFLAGFAYPFEGEPKNLIPRDVVTSSMDIRNNNKDIVANRLFLFHYNTNNGELTKKLDTEVPEYLLFDTASNKAEELIPYAIRQVYPAENGGYQLVCEQFQSTRMISGTNNNYYFKFYDIAVIETNAAQQPQQVWRFPKRQMGGAEASLLSTRVNGRLHILYSDLQENLNLPPGEKPKMAAGKDGKNGLFLATITGGIVVQKEILYPFQAGQPVPQVLLSTVTAPGEVMLMAKEGFGMLRLE